MEHNGAEDIRLVGIDANTLTNELRHMENFLRWIHCSARGFLYSLIYTETIMYNQEEH